MVSQTKKFIELSDIIAFRFECSACGAYATMPFGDFRRVPRACVNCGVEWEAPHAQYVHETFQRLGEAMRNAQHMAADRKILFTLEIKGEPEKERAAK